MLGKYNNTNRYLILNTISIAMMLWALASQSANAQPASIDGNTVIIPTLEFDSIYYTLHLTIIPNTGNQYFSVTLAQENPNPVIENASTLNFGHTLNVPLLNYAGQSYSVEFVITSQDPVTLKLNGIAEKTGSNTAQNPNSIDLGNLLSSSAETQINLYTSPESFRSSLLRQLSERGFNSVVEIIVGEDCKTSDAAHFRIEALSKDEIVLDSQGQASFTLNDFDKVDVFYSEAGRPQTSTDDYCPPMTSADWTSLKDFIVREGNRIVELDFTDPPADFDRYHAANHGGLIYEFSDRDQLPPGLTTSTRYSTQSITDLNMTIQMDDNGTFHSEGGLEAIYDDTGSASVDVSFVDFDGQEMSVQGNVEASPGKAKAWTPLMPPGPGLTGCWDQADGDNAWCFFNNGTGQFIQESVNGNPGTLYITFSFSANVGSGSLTYNNTYIELVGSCCDKAESLNEPSYTESFRLYRNVFRIGGTDYIYTSRNLAR